MVIVRRTVTRSPERVQQEMERVFRSLVPTRPHVAHHASALWRPPIEVIETDDALVVTAEIAGMDEQALSVVVEGDVLSIRGERPDDREGERRQYREAGIAYGGFGADVYLPFPIDVDQAHAAYTMGFLRITLPKVAARTIVPRRPRISETPDEGTR
jgi:HSP20 family protein